MLSRNRFCLLDGKIRDKSPDHLFDLNCFDIMLHKITFQASVQSFLIWVAEVPRKNSFLCCSLFLCFCPGFSFAILQSLSLLFLCKIFWDGKKNSIPSWQYLLAVEENYFSRALTSLISLQWVMYEGSFQVRDGRWWKKILECHASKLGDAPMQPQEIFKETQTSKLGDALVHPVLHQQPSVCPSLHYIFITSCVVCYAWSVSLFTFLGLFLLCLL